MKDFLTIIIRDRAKYDEAGRYAAFKQDNGNNGVFYFSKNNILYLDIQKARTENEPKFFTMIVNLVNGHKIRFDFSLEHYSNLNFFWCDIKQNKALIADDVNYD